MKCIFVVVKLFPAVSVACSLVTHLYSLGIFDLNRWTLGHFSDVAAGLCAQRGAVFADTSMCPEGRERLPRLLNAGSARRGCLSGMASRLSLLSGSLSAATAGRVSPDIPTSHSRLRRGPRGEMPVPVPRLKLWKPGSNTNPGQGASPATDPREVQLSLFVFCLFVFSLGF